ncbi:MAG: hypothetical protein AAF378_08340 [Cyanobacteria bacterium P01_A01_bin.84]
MTKPLGYFTDYRPLEDSYLYRLEQKYGSWFQHMSVREKLFLINSISSHLCSEAADECRNEIFVISNEITTQVSPSDLEGMIEFLIQQVKAS